MRKAKMLRPVAIALPLLALLVSVVVVAGIGGQQPNQDLEPNGRGGDDDECICTLQYDPVVCDDGGQRVVYSNACFAACDGFTRCEPLDNTIDRP